VRPSQVWSSAGHRNRFNFPRPEVVERVAKLGARQIGTAESGAVGQIFLAGAVGIPQLARATQTRWWHEVDAPASGD